MANINLDQIRKSPFKELSKFLLIGYRKLCDEPLTRSAADFVTTICSRSQDLTPFLDEFGHIKLEEKRRIIKYFVPASVSMRHMDYLMDFGFHYVTHSETRRDDIISNFILSIHFCYPGNDIKEYEDSFYVLVRTVLYDEHDFTFEHDPISTNLEKHLIMYFFRKNGCVILSYINNVYSFRNLNLHFAPETVYDLINQLSSIHL